jgi:uncharacterized protein YutE (UPF0331/DUF86 family)
MVNHEVVLKKITKLEEYVNELLQAKDISWKKVPDYQNMASFRNILVHHYEKVEDEVVFSIFKNKLGDFFLFKKSILEYINKDKNA